MPLPSPAPSPVAWRWRKALTKEHWQLVADWGDWHLCEHEPQGPATEKFQIEPLYAAVPVAQPEQQDSVYLTAPVQSEGLQTALRELLDAIHAGRLIPLDRASEGYCGSVVSAGEAALEAYELGKPA